MNPINIEYCKSPCGELVVGSLNGELVLCDWRYRRMRFTIDKRIRSGSGADYIEQSSPTIELAKIQLGEYFAGKRKVFHVPLRFIGTDFQKSVWEQLQRVPFGRTATYLDLAKAMGRPESVRAVANANGANALSIFVPCHRIIGSDGALVGYAGGVEAKRKLLDLENEEQGELPLTA
jgi:methylated-DNA-[protein]-cysteine S-methyltransferase